MPQKARIFMTTHEAVAAAIGKGHFDDFADLYGVHSQTARRYGRRPRSGGDATATGSTSDIHDFIDFLKAIKDAHRRALKAGESINGKGWRWLLDYIQEEVGDDDAAETPMSDEELMATMEQLESQIEKLRRNYRFKRNQGGLKQAG